MEPGPVFCSAVINIYNSFTWTRESFSSLKLSAVFFQRTENSIAWKASINAKDRQNAISRKFFKTFTVQSDIILR